MADENQDVAEARRLGADEGKAFDRELRRIERDDQLSRLLAAAAGAGREGGGDAAPAPEPGAPVEPLTSPVTGSATLDAVQQLEEYDLDRPSLDTLSLRREVDRLTIYYNAVQNSRAWRLTQRLRQIVGRAW
jgi:hypothetical protein